MNSKTDQPAPSLFLLQDSASEYLFYVGKDIYIVTQDGC